MSELDYLLELLLEHELPDETNKSLRKRIRLVQKSPQLAHNPPPLTLAVPKVIHGAIQSPSMAAKIADMEMHKPTATKDTPIAVTPQAQAAVASRQQAIALAGVNEKGRTSPRKF